MNLKAPNIIALSLVALSVAACSSERQDTPGFSVVQALIKRQAEPVVSDNRQVEAAVAASLAALDGPLALATFEKTQNNVVLREIETNGQYRTWASVSSAERRNLSTLNGVITSTRGLTQDLMSSDISQSLALISSRSSGTATRVQRYLDGENQISTVTAQCSVSRGDQARVKVGEIDRMTVQMTERCQDGDRSFTNIYRVDSSGRVLQSVQWLNDFYGAAVIQQLR